jgi:hypothetical protein
MPLAPTLPVGRSWVLPAPIPVPSALKRISLSRPSAPESRTEERVVRSGETTQSEEEERPPRWFDVTKVGPDFSKLSMLPDSI